VIKLLLGCTIVPTTYWGSWTFITLTNAYRFIIEQRPILFESLVWVDDDTFLFQQYLKMTNNFYHLQNVCLLPFEQPIGQQIDQFQDSILKHLWYHTFSTMFFEEMFNAHGLQHMSSHVSITFYKKICNVLDLVQTSLSFDCMSSSICLHLTHWPLMGIYLLLCAHDDERTRTHDVLHNMFASIA